MKLRRFFILGFLLVSGIKSIAQIETIVLDKTLEIEDRGLGYMFTNRPVVYKSDSSPTFAEKWVKQTGTLYYADYYPDNDSLSLKVKTTKLCSKKEYPTDPDTSSFIYESYLLSERYGVKTINILIPGYSKSFSTQRKVFMQKIQERYADTLFDKAAFITFAWGSEWSAPRYHRGKRSAKRSANDFSIWQHQLEEFLSDSAFFEDRPRDISINLICLSMGNYVLYKYLQRRKKQGIPFRKSYNSILLAGGDVSWKAFEKNKGYEFIHEIADSTFLLVNQKDVPLSISQILNGKKRLGKNGPKHREILNERVEVVDVQDYKSEEDVKGGLGHDYFMRNQWIQSQLIIYMSTPPPVEASQTNNSSQSGSQ